MNGVDQGIAYIHLTKENRYYPAASLYMGAAVRFNPGPTFNYPLSTDKYPSGTVRPISDLENMSNSFGSSNNHYNTASHGNSSHSSSSNVIEIAANLQLLQRGTGPPTSLDIPYNFTGTQFAYTGNTTTTTTQDTNTTTSGTNNSSTTISSRKKSHHHDSSSKGKK